MTQRNLVVISITALLYVNISCTPSEPVAEPTADLPYEESFEPTPTAAFLSPQESMNRIHVPEGYRLELVASEPMIEEPVTLA